jgi:hypothetical protein
MSFFRKLRPFVARALMYSSFYMGFSCWWYSFIVLYQMAGGWFILIGILILGIGIVPLAFLAAVLHGYWSTFWNLVLAVAFFFVPRLIVIFISHREAKREEQEMERLRLKEGLDNNLWLREESE